MNPLMLQFVLGSCGLALAALLAGIWLRLWRRDPLASYRMAVIVLAVTLSMPLAQWAARETPLPKSLSFLGEWTQAVLGAKEPGARTAEVQLHTITEPGSWTDELPMYVLGSLDPASVEGQLQLLGRQAGRTQADIEELRLEEQALLGRLELSAETKTAWYRRPLVAGLDAAWLGLFLYLFGFGIALLRTGLRLIRTRALLRSAQPVRNEDSLELWAALQKGSSLEGRVRLLESDQIRVPMCFGLGTPAVVLPLGGRAGLDADLFSCVLLHELVHLERRDTWVMLGQEFARSLFWFHPAAWWLCSRIDLLRELSCDLLVVRRTGRRKRYATALVEYAARMRDELGPSQAQATALLPWSSSTHQLSRRIEMLVKHSAAKSAGSRRSMMLAAGSLFGVLWGGQLATAAAMTPAQEGDASELDITELLDAIEEGEQAMPADQSSPIVLRARAGQATPVVEGQAVPIIVSQQTEGPVIGISLDDSVEHGIRIVGVNPGSLGERAGLEVGDIITKVNGQEVTLDLLLKERSGIRDGKFKLELLRGDDVVKVKIKDKSGKHKMRSEVHVEEHGAHTSGHDAHSLPKDVQGFRFEIERDSDGNLIVVESDGSKYRFSPNPESTENHFVIRAGEEGLNFIDGDIQLKTSGGSGGKVFVVTSDGTERELKGSIYATGNISVIREDDHATHAQKAQTETHKVQAIWNVLGKAPEASADGTVIIIDEDGTKTELKLDAHDVGNWISFGEEHDKHKAKRLHIGRAGQDSGEAFVLRTVDEDGELDLHALRGLLKGQSGNLKKKEIDLSELHEHLRRLAPDQDGGAKELHGHLKKVLKSMLHSDGDMSFDRSERAAEHLNSGQYTVSGSPSGELLWAALEEAAPGHFSFKIMGAGESGTDPSAADSTRKPLPDDADHFTYYARSGHDPELRARLKQVIKKHSANGELTPELKAKVLYQFSTEPGGEKASGYYLLDSDQGGHAQYNSYPHGDGNDFTVELKRRAFPGELYSSAGESPFHGRQLCEDCAQKLASESTHRNPFFAQRERAEGGNEIELELRRMQALLRERQRELEDMKRKLEALRKRRH